MTRATSSKRLARVVLAGLGVWGMVLGHLTRQPAAPFLAVPRWWSVAMMLAGAAAVLVAVRWVRWLAAAAVSVIVSAMAMRSLGYVVTDRLQGTARQLGVLVWLGLALLTSLAFTAVVMPGHRR